MSGEASPRRIVLAVVHAPDAALQAIASGEVEDLAADPAWRVARPLRFVPRLGPASIAASIATGVPPSLHGVLTAWSIDEATLAPRSRRAGDADRPWIWTRWAGAGRRAIVAGLPGIADPRDAGVPVATHAATLRPLEYLARTLGGPPRPAEADAAPPVAPAESARAVAESIAAVLPRTPLGGDVVARSALSARIALAAAAGLESAAAGDASPAGPTLWVVGASALVETAERDAAPEARADDPRASAALGVAAVRAAVAELARSVGEQGILLAAVHGESVGRLVTVGLSIDAAGVAAVDLVPTLLEAAGLDVPADLPGRVLVPRRREGPRSWAVAAARPDAGSAARPAAGVLARRALAARQGAERSAEDDSAPTIEGVLARHFEAEWTIAFEQADWPAAASTAESLVELRGHEVDLWRLAFAAERSGDRPSLARAADLLRSTRPDGTATRLLPLLDPSPPSRELLESLDLDAIRVATQRSVVGRAAARIGLEDLAVQALSSLVAAGVGLPADRIVLAGILLRRGDGAKALLALGGLGDGTAPRIRLLRARCLAAADRRAEAVELLDRHLAEQPLDGEARTLRERILLGG